MTRQSSSLRLHHARERLPTISAMVRTGTLARTPTTQTTRGSITSPVPKPRAPPATAAGNAAASRTRMPVNEGTVRVRCPRSGAGHALEWRLPLDDTLDVAEREPHLGAKGIERPGAHVRGEDDVVQGRQRVSWRERLRREDIESRSGDPTLAERFEQSILVHDSAARDVDEVRARLHLGEEGAVHQMPRLVGQRDVADHHVRLAEKALPRDQLDPAEPGALLGGEGDVRVAGKQAHAKAERPLGGGATGPPESEEAEGL